MRAPLRNRLGLAGLALVVVAVAFGATGAEGGTAPRASPPEFRGSVERIDRDLRKRITGNSWHRGCPVPISGLRLLRVRHWNFDREVSRGYLMVNAGHARPMLRVMRRLFELRFAIRRMRLVDAYGSDDRRSMRADNTSAFNCREVSGQPGVWSQHAYGLAIDLNTVENPYVSGSYVSPPNGRAFAKRRPHRKGMITPGGKVVRAFAGIGWEWGGYWSGTKDYQHFSATGT
ncbi:MAG: M15 family metallopeptidase [Solirubrobacterales bacterium]